jgi:hypothetical protein
VAVARGRRLRLMLMLPLQRWIHHPCMHARSICQDQNITRGTAVSL